MKEIYTQCIGYICSCNYLWGNYLTVLVNC